MGYCFLPNLAQNGKGRRFLAKCENLVEIATFWQFFAPHGWQYIGWGGGGSCKHRPLHGLLLHAKFDTYRDFACCQSCSDLAMLTVSSLLLSIDCMQEMQVVYLHHMRHICCQQKRMMIVRSGYEQLNSFCTLSLVEVNSYVAQICGVCYCSSSSFVMMLRQNFMLHVCATSSASYC